MTKAIGSTTSDSSIVSESTVDESEWDESNISRSLEDGKLLLQRLVDQNVDILLGYLRGISARRLVLQRLNHQTRISSWEEEPQIGVSMLEEAQEAIQAPTFDLRLAMNAVEPALLEIPSEVESQLRNYVSSIATAYRQTNPFHSFEHASHVVRTMDQMIKKMRSSSDVLVTGFDGKPRSAGEIAKEMDQKTFSIASDPLLQFTLVFAALVHDVDHIGVSNQQLIKESSPIASLYKNRSVSEQNAVDISWWLLMTADFEKLRSAIYTDTTDMRRFRQCLVNCVIATDILDRTMKDHRDYNWNKCFVRRTHFMDWDEKRNLQATAVAEALMQAADAGHCLQPFRSYLKWNERLFDEMYQAYHAGRADIDPSTQWYQAELAFFDKFLIPLLTRLKQSGVFGGYGEAYLKNATDNRDQWKAQGPTIVREMMDEFSRRVVAAQDDIISFT
jgi:3'5'-cyclic nucleotide phosphodiesterase